MFFLVLATAATGLFAGAAVYINLVEHPARISCGIDLALKEFRPSYRRATLMQASLAIVGVASGLLAVAREASGLVGISVLGLIVTAGHPVPPHGPLGAAFTSGYGAALLTAAGLAVIAAVIARVTLPAARYPLSAESSIGQDLSNAVDHHGQS